MNHFQREINAVAAIAGRDVTRFLRSPARMVISLIWPVVFMGILGGSLDQNLGGGANFDLLKFILFGVVVMMLYQTTLGSLVSLVRDRENDFTQALFVAPISRYAIMIGKIIGGTMMSQVSLIGVFGLALLMQIPLTLADIIQVLLVSPLICFAGGALGILFISVASDPQAAEGGIPLLVFPQMFLAGVLIPINQSSGVLGVLSHLMPMTYLADLMRSIAYAGHPQYNQIVLYSPAVNLAVVAVTTTVFILAGTLVFNRAERTR